MHFLRSCNNVCAHCGEDLLVIRALVILVLNTFFGICHELLRFCNLKSVDMGHALSNATCCLLHTGLLASFIKCVIMLDRCFTRFINVANYVYMKPSV